MIPMQDNVVVLIDKEEKKTEAGIILQGENSTQTHLEGTVVAHGDGFTEDGHTRPITVKEGDRVMFVENKANRVKYNGKEHFIIPERDIMAIIER